MMFQSTPEMEQRFSKFAGRVEALCSSLEPLAEKEDIQSLIALRENFLRKTSDFFREERKLNIGVIGQVKAGKSTFLNTLLFDGATILPKAPTPKTATLTKIEYAPENRILIEYYTPEEWNNIGEDAQIDDDGEIYRSARELIRLAEKNGLDPLPYLQKGSESIPCASYEDLSQRLNDYVGENGLYTPLVKCVTLEMDREELRDLSIVDTPGLNDPIQSRTQKTTEFIQLCDVVFFLSKASHFLDQSDVDLLRQQLPRKGVRRMVVVGSRFDNAMQDILRLAPQKNDPFQKDFKKKEKTNNLPEARKMGRETLEKGVAKQKEAAQTDGSNQIFLDSIGPIPISSIAENIARNGGPQNSEEENIYQSFLPFLHGADPIEEMAAVGNFAEVRAVYDQVVQEKEGILLEKSGVFVPTALQELQSLLAQMLDRMKSRLSMLERNDRAQLEKQRLSMERQINAIRADIAEAFGATLEALRREKANAIRELRKMSAEASALEERTGTETKTGSRTYYKHNFLCFHWGQETSYYTYESSYTYLAASDALEQINAFGKNASNRIEESFQAATDTKALRRRLLNAVIENCNTGGEGYDASFVRLVVQKSLDDILFPQVNIDVSAPMDAINKQFSGQVRSSDDQEKLRSLLRTTVDSVYKMIEEQVNASSNAFEGGLLEIRTNLADTLLEKINLEFTQLEQQCSEKEKTAQRMRAYIAALEQERTKFA